MSSFLESLGFRSEFPRVIMKAICIGIEQLSKGQVKQNEHTSGKILRWLYVMCTVPIQLSKKINYIFVWDEIQACFKRFLK